MKKFAIALLALAACGTPSPQKPAGTNAPVDVDGTKLTVSGPYQHQNLAVYVIHAPQADDPDYITLDEALARKWVDVTEKSDEQVNELMLENKSDRPLFIQEGDRVVGGKQDRIIGASFVVPPKSGKIGVPSFCVEHGRWTEGANGRKFSNGDNNCLAGKTIRQAAKYSKDQQEVWDKVAEAKKEANKALNAPNENSSLNETLEDKKVKELCDAYAAALSDVVTAHKDAVGVAIVLNGRIEEINVYPGHALLVKLYPRVVQSYALAAATTKSSAVAPAAGEIVRYMSESENKAKKTDAINGQNKAEVVDLEKQVRCDTRYLGKAVHRQWMTK